MKKREADSGEDMESSQSTLPPPPEPIAEAIPQDIAVATPPDSPQPELPVDMSVCPAPEEAELQLFENQLVSTGLYPGDLSEEVIHQYGGQPEIPGIHPSDPDNERVVHMVNIARAVGVEVAQANHVLVKEMLDRQGGLNSFLNFAIRGAISSVYIILFGSRD